MYALPIFVRNKPFAMAPRLNHSVRLTSWFQQCHVPLSFIGVALTIARLPVARSTLR